MEHGVLCAIPESGDAIPISQIENFIGAPCVIKAKDLDNKFLVFGDTIDGYYYEVETKNVKPPEKKCGV